MISVVVISKDEPALESTLLHLSRVVAPAEHPVELIVVDASSGRLDALRGAYPDVQWYDFSSTSGKRITIPEQRNVGVAVAKGEIIVFTDAGCEMEADWVTTLVGPLLAGEEVCVAGGYRGTAPTSLYAVGGSNRQYVAEAPTLNLAVSRQVLDRLGGFDETFDYGSDVDLCWRMNDAGHRILLEPQALVRHDFEKGKKQLKRSYLYGAARARLYVKHRSRIRTALRRDPVAVVYPLFLLGLPIALAAKCRTYPLLLVVPAWRARYKRPVATVIDHLAYGAGALGHMVGLLGASRRLHDSSTQDAAL